MKQDKRREMEVKELERYMVIEEAVSRLSEEVKR